jgi:hypothetical protein
LHFWGKQCQPTLGLRQSGGCNRLRQSVGNYSTIAVTIVGIYCKIKIKFNMDSIFIRIAYTLLSITKAFKEVSLPRSLDLISKVSPNIHTVCI